MGKKENKKEQSPLEQITELSQEAQRELSKITEELLGLAKQVKEEFGEDNMDEFDEQMNEMSASITQIHEDSPYLDEIFKGDSWKKVIKTGTPIPPIKPMKKEDNEDGEK